MKNSMARTIRFLAPLAVLLARPSSAFACAACILGMDDESRVAFEWATAFMTVTPFLLCGGFFWWIRGRFKQLESMHDEAREQGHREAAEAPSPVVPRLVALDSGER